jgi:hypothetical protein
MPSQKLVDQKNRLSNACRESIPAIRGARIAAIISEAFKEAGTESVLVGGAAVAFYTNGDYTTHDIDMIATVTPECRALMTSLGFENRGKDYINKKLNIYIEFPNDRIGPTERYNILKVDQFELKIISLEDLIADRLCVFKFWRSGIDGVNALRLLELGGGDRKRIEERASEEDILDALDHVENVLQTSIRRKLTPKETNQLLENYFKRLK